MKEGSLAQHNSPVIEIWKGRYKGEEVALKVLRVDRGRADIPRIRGVSVSRSSQSVSDRHGSGSARK